MMWSWFAVCMPFVTQVQEMQDRDEIGTSQRQTGVSFPWSIQGGAKWCVCFRDLLQVSWCYGTIAEGTAIVLREHHLENEASRINSFCSNPLRESEIHLTRCKWLGAGVFLGEYAKVWEIKVQHLERFGQECAESSMKHVKYTPCLSEPWASR